MAPLLSSAEINLLIYHYLSDSGFNHSAFSLRHEASLDSNPITATAVVPPGQLVTFLTKGLLYKAVEEHVRPDGSQKPCSTPFRLVGPPHICDGVPRPSTSTDPGSQLEATPTGTRLTPSPPPETSTSNTRRNTSSIGIGTNGGDLDTREVAAQTSTPPPQPSSSSTLNGKGNRSITSPVASTSTSAINESNSKRKAATSTASDSNPTAGGSSSGGVREDKRLKRDRETEGSSSTMGKGSNSSINGIKSSNNNSTSSPTKGKGKSRDLEDQQDENMELGESSSKKRSKDQDGNENSKSRLVNGSGSGSGSGLGKKGGNNPNGRNGKAGKKKNQNSLDENDDSMERNTEENMGEDEEEEAELKTPKLKKKKVTTTNTNSTSSGNAQQQGNNKPGPKAGGGRLPPDNLPPSRLTPLPASLQNDAMTLPSSKVTALTGHSAEVFVTAWNPSVPGLIASGAGDATVRIWEVPEGSGGAVVSPPTKSKASSAQVNSTDSHSNKKLIDAPAICKHLPSTHSKDISALSWNPDGTLLASGSYDGILRLWTPQGDLHLVLSMHQGPIFGVKWNRRGTEILTGSQDGTAIVWDMQSGKVKQQFSLHSDSVLDVDWLTGGYPDQESLESSSGSNFDASSSSAGGASHSTRRSATTLSGPFKRNLALDNIFATASADNSLKILRVGDSKPVRTLRGHTDEVNALRFDPTATLLASASDDNTARIWSVGNELGVISNGNGNSNLGKSGRRGGTPAGKSLSNSTKEEEVRRRRSSSMTGINTSNLDDENSNNDSGNGLAGSSSNLGISTSTSNLLASGTVAPSNSEDIKLNRDSNSPNPGEDEDSITRNASPLPSFSCLHVLKGHTRELYSLAWSPSNIYSNIVSISTTSGKENGQSQQQPPKLLATTSFDHTCRIWNAVDGSCLRVLQNHDEAVYCVAWSPLGRWIATGGLDCRVFVWDVETGNVVKHYTGGGGVFDLSWRRELSNSTSKYKAIVDGDGDVEMTDADKSQLTEDEIKPSISNLEKEKVTSKSGSPKWNHRIAVSQGNKTLAVLDLDSLGGLQG